jgi:hypothetical protein
MVELFEIVAFALGLFPWVNDALGLFDLTERLFGRVRVDPEIILRGPCFERGYLCFEGIDVKDTSVSYRRASPDP